MRKLATAALAYSAAVFAANYVLPVEWLPVCAAVLAAVCLAGIFLKGRARQLLLLIAVSASVAFGWYWTHHRLFIAPWTEAQWQMGEITARVTDYSYETESYRAVNVNLHAEGMPSVKAQIYDYSENLPVLEPGDVITARVKFRSAEYFNDTETDYNTSKGIFVLATLQDKVTSCGRDRFSWLWLPKVLTRLIEDSVAACFPENVSHVVTALLTGETGGLREDGELNEAMGRAGLLHVVSVSGMHIAFLLSSISLAVRKKKTTAMIGIPVIIIFSTMVGGNSSVIRAGFMQIMLLIAPLFRRENDSITTLSAVLGLLLLTNPQAAGSVSLQLSFSAMAGIILVSPRVYSSSMGLFRDSKAVENKFFAAAVRFVLRSFASTIGAIVFSTPLTALHFGYVSLLSPVTNLFTLWAMSLVFSLGFVTAFAGLVLPALGGVFGWVLACPVRYVIAVVKFISAIPFAAVYTRGNLFGWWLAFTYLLFIFCYAAKGKNPFRPILPTSLSVCTLCTVFILSWLSAGTPGRSAAVTVLDVGQGQSIVVCTDEATVVIDCGSWGSSYEGANAAAEFLLSQGRDSIDLLVLTHFHSDHANGVPLLLDKVEVERIAAPDELGEEDSVYGKVMEAAEEDSVEIITVLEDSTLTVGDVELGIYAPIGSASVNERGIIILADFGDFEMLVTGDVNSEIERRFISKTVLPDIEMLVVGHHGSKYSTCAELLEAVTPEIGVISVGDNNYGHPTVEVLDRLKDAGITVYRTDVNGNVSVRVN